MSNPARRWRAYCPAALRKPYLPLLVLCLVATACSPPPALPALGKDDVIVALGDSLTAGQGGRGISYPQHLQTLIGRTVINAGINGETSAGARQRVAGLLATHKPRLLIVCTGGNDLLLRQNLAETEANLSAIVAQAHEQGVAVVLLAVPRVLPLPLNHPLYDRIASEYNLWIEDDILKTVLHDNGLKSDQIHPNADGYRKMAEAVANLLRRAGAIA